MSKNGEKAPPQPIVLTPAPAIARVSVWNPTITITEPLLPPKSSDLLLQAIIESSNKNDEGTLIRAVALPWFQILRQIQDAPGFLYEFAKHPRKLEEFIAGCYCQQGFTDVVLTPSSGDLGIDVIVSATLPGVGKLRFVDQVKAYSPGHLVPAKDVRELAGVLSREPNTTKGIITTTSTFAPGVTAEFSSMIPNRLLLKDSAELRGWLQELSKSSD